MKTIRTFVAPVMIIVFAVAGSAIPIVSTRQTALAASPDKLHLDVFVGADSWNVTSTLIYGKSEAILVDGQLRISQAKKLADQIAARGRRLKGIITTHPDEDHYFGIAVLHERFPDTPIYMTAAALEQFKSTSSKYLAGFRKRAPSETPESLPTPEVLPTAIFTVDGETVDVIKDFQGDVLKPTNSFLWIPSLRAVIAGDVVFNGVYAYLADSNPESRRAWHDSLELMAALHPQVVIAGHKRNADAPDSPEAILSMEKYLDDYESARKAASDADQLVTTMKQKYPEWTQEELLVFSAKAAFPGATPK
jgi:glyoxylase-like metal-dependent hydrolase (beta-lactamase superfamily II)